MSTSRKWGWRERGAQYNIATTSMDELSHKHEHGFVVVKIPPMLTMRSAIPLVKGARDSPIVESVTGPWGQSVIFYTWSPTRGAPKWKKNARL